MFWREIYAAARSVKLRVARSLCLLGDAQFMHFVPTYSQDAHGLRLVRTYVCT